MSRQDKATTERHARTLRELVKRPENKVCADCKRNDPRWASWNLGVFLCIRCSGIHRSMGTHISKVKSVDLDMWTPEQMDSIQKWGNHLANLYWEAHLKPGHIPPDHKIDSFIRSKYETRRWAMEGPPPSDPSTLENGSSVQAQPPPPVSPPPQPQTRQPQTTARTSAQITTRQPQPHQLLSSAHVGNQSISRAPPTVAPTQVQQELPSNPPAIPQNDLFSLDFHGAPTSPAEVTQPKSNMKGKEDILSLFSSPPAAVTSAPNSSFGQFGGGGAAVWGAQPPQPQPQPQQATSMMGSTGWGAGSGWNATSPNSQTSAGFNNLWGAPAGQPQQQSQPDPFGNVWGSGGGGFGGTTSGPDPFGSSFSASNGKPAAPKTDDAFGDLWK